MLDFAAAEHVSPFSSSPSNAFGRRPSWVGTFSHSLNKQLAKLRGEVTASREVAEAAAISSQRSYDLLDVVGRQD